jgi:hypothetical protein
MPEIYSVSQVERVGKNLPQILFYRALFLSQRGAFTYEKRRRSE